MRRPLPVPTSEALHRITRCMHEELDEIEKEPLSFGGEVRTDQNNRCHLDADFAKRPAALPDGDRAEAREAVRKRGASPETVDDFLASRFRREPLKPRRWSVEGFGAGVTKGVVGALAGKGDAGADA